MCKQIVFAGVTETKAEQTELTRATREMILNTPLIDKWSLWGAEVLARPVTAREDSVVMTQEVVKE